MSFHFYKFDYVKIIQAQQVSKYVFLV